MEEDIAWKAKLRAKLRALKAELIEKLQKKEFLLVEKKKKEPLTKFVRLLELEPPHDTGEVVHDQLQNKSTSGPNLEQPAPFETLDQVTEALAHAGLEPSNLIVGIDFTKSDQQTREPSFMRQRLHHIGHSPNPYEQAISIIGKTMAAFDEDNLIPCFGFGDSSTHDQEVFSFYTEESLCNGFEEVLTRYRELVPNIRLAGPRSFAPIVETATKIVERSGGQHHVLVILANGQVTRSGDSEHGGLSTQEQKTVDAILQASKFPLSIILVGVGNGPWDMMKEFHDNIPTRAFDNFQFVNFTEIMSNNMSPSQKEAAFALAAFKEIPSQYKAVIELDRLGSRKANAPNRVCRLTPSRLGPSSSTHGIQNGLPVRSEIFSPCTWYRECLIKAVDFGYLHEALALVSARTRGYITDLLERVDANGESGLPLFIRPDLRNTSPGFMQYVRDSVINIPPKYNWALLLLCGSYLISQMKNTTAPYQYFQLLEKTTNAPQQPLMLTSGEAYNAFYQEITDMTKFLLCYLLCLALIFPLHPGVQIVCLLLWVLTPFTYFPDLFRNSSRAGVTCGSFKLAPLSFTSLGAVGISTICLAATMLIVYMKFRLSNGNPRVVEDVDGSLDGLAEVLEE